MAPSQLGTPGRSRRRRRTALSAVLILVVGGTVVLATTVPREGSTASLHDPRAGQALGRQMATVATTTSTAPTTTTTPPVCDRRAALDGDATDAPPELHARVADALAHPSWVDLDRSISVWVEGHGEVVAVGADTALLPASNQKLLTAIGSHLVLDPAGRFRTEVRRSGDRLVLVADGDPTLRATGPHSLAALADQVARAGAGPVAGIGVDASRFEATTTARGWQDWQMPTYVGPLSALVVDDNRGRSDPAFLADPALAHASAFAARLAGAGVGAGGPVVHASAGPDDPVVAALDSASVDELTRSMLVRSDNEIAESLLREIGDGSTDAGLDRITAALEPWCLHLTGAGGDGSGLSRANLRSAREWRRLLQVAGAQPWGATLREQLPVAGRSGTLAGRLGGPTTVGNVQAKTGSIIGGSALSGYATTTDGRAVVFSIVVNGEPGPAQAAVAGIDRLVTAVVG